MAMPHGARPSVRRRCGGGWVCLPGIIPAVDVVQPDCTASNAKGRAKIFPSLLFAVSHFIRKFAVSSGFFMLPYGMKRKNLGFSGTKTEHKNKRCTEIQSVTPLCCRDEATRTPDPYVPNVVRYQLRYIPILRCKDRGFLSYRQIFPYFSFFFPAK